MSLRSRKILRLSLKVLGLPVLFLIASATGTLGYFHFAPPAKTCASCHEMQTHIDRWASSAHQGVHCRNCHGGALTFDVHALQQHARRLVGHFGDSQPQRIRLSHEDILAISNKCQPCHAAQYNRWKTGRHSATFSYIFLNPQQNQSELLNADCTRCHGMFFPGSTDALVTPVDTTGPWTLQHPTLADQPTMPCLTCHQMHAARPTDSAAGPTTRPTPAALFSRHEQAHFPANLLPTVAIQQDSHPLRISPDPRQRLCMQCHAPDASHHAGTSDDRTPTGVHEGLSCLDCHDPHATTPLTTCNTCHAGKTIKSPDKKVHARS